MTVVNPNGQTKTTRFNNLGYTIEQMDELGQTVQFDRGENNVLTSKTDTLGRETVFEYDALGNILAVTNPDNQTTRYEYDPTFSRLRK